MPKERKSRKPRADSKEQAVIAMIHADKQIDPPADMDLNAHQALLFHEVIDEFAKIDWSKHTIRLAAVLACALSFLQAAQDQLADESFTATSARGTPVANPLIGVCQTLSGQVLSLRRSLALHAVAGVNKSDVGKRRGINKANERNSPLNDDDGEDFATPDQSIA